MILDDKDVILSIPEFKKQIKSFLSFKKEDLKCYIFCSREINGAIGTVALISIPKTVYDIVEINLLNLKLINGSFMYDIKTIYSSIILDKGEPYVNIQGNTISLNILKDRLEITAYINKYEKTMSEVNKLQ